MSNVPSPCTRQCAVDSENVCLGCGRTVREIRIWHKSSDEEKLEIIAKSQRRLDGANEDE